MAGRGERRGGNEGGEEGWQGGVARRGERRGGNEGGEEEGGGGEERGYSRVDKIREEEIGLCCGIFIHVWICILVHV